MQIRLTPTLATFSFALFAALLLAIIPTKVRPDALSLSPVGLWKTIDDKTGKAKAIVRIYEEHGKLFGSIEQSFRPGSQTRVCDLCTDERKGKPILGLVVIRDLHADGNQFSGGDILDPESGTIYRCKMSVQPGGSRLIVRGYLGIALLGRSQTWERQN